MDNKELPESLVETFTKTDLPNILKDISEIGIDKIMFDGFLKELPVIQTITGIWKAGVVINDYRFLNKLLAFLNESSKLSNKQREKILEKLEYDKNQNEAGEKLISIIDNLETKSKAILLGKTIYLFGNKIIKKEEFWRISYMIERLPMEDIIFLKNWKNHDLNLLDDIRKQLYVSVGLGTFTLLISSTGLFWNERYCMIISEKILKTLD